MPVLRLLLLGPVRLETFEGREIAGLGGKAKAVLAFVAAQPAGICERERLAELIWDGPDGGRARHALRQTLLVLRRSLGDAAGEVIAADPGTIGLRPEAVAVDLHAFEAGLRDGGDDALAAASGLWRGPFCDGLTGGAGFEDWLALGRARLDEMAAEAFGRLARLEAGRGRLEQAEAAARRRVALDPFDDAAQAELIALCRRRGRVGAARTAHRRCTELFRHELGVKPGAEVAAAAQVAPGRRAPLRLPSAENRPQRWRQRALQRAGAVAALLTLLLLPSWELERPQPPAPRAAAWVTADEGLGDASYQPAVPGVSAPAAGSGAARADAVDQDEALARALALDPAYAHLYPAGC